MSGTTLYGDITPRTAAFVASDLLERAMPFQCMGKFGQMRPIPKNKTQTQRFRRFDLVEIVGVYLGKPMALGGDQMKAIRRPEKNFFR